MSSPDDVPSTSKRTDNDGAIDYGTLDTDMEHDIVPYIDGSPTPPLLKTPPGMKTSSDTVMEPDQSIRLKPSTSPLPWPFRDSLSPSEMVMRPECLKEDRTPLPLRTSPGRMTPSDDGVGPDSMGFPKSGDGKTSPIPPELQAFWDDFGPKFMELQKSPDGKTSPILSELQTLLANTSTQPITSNLEAEDEVRIEDFPDDDLMNKLGVPIPKTHQPTETCTGKRPNEETNLLRDEAQSTETGNVQANIPRIDYNGKIYETLWIKIKGTYEPIWMHINEPDNKPEFNNGDSIMERIDSGDVAPSQSSNVIGPSRASTSGTPVRDSKRKAEGNEIAENKRWKVTPLYARELTEDEELNKRIVKARTTQRHREKNTTLTKKLEKENTDLKSENTVLKSQVAQCNLHRI